MHKPSYRNAPLTQGVALALGVSFAGPSVAEQERVVEEVVTTGIRSSLRQSMEYKRDAKGVVDAISAEDIGDFPDTNLAESLQRITGVSIDRERGEGAKVTVRGFGPNFNLVLLNGRQMPTTSGLDRSFDFSNISSEGVAAVEVFKSGKADVPTGGIGSTINVKTSRPLDSPGLKARASAAAMYDDSATELSDAEWSPELSGLFSNTFADDTIGVSLTGVYQKRKSGEATASVNGWRTFEGDVSSFGGGGASEDWGGIPVNDDQVNRPEAGDLYSVPQVIGYEMAEYDRKRINGQLTFQYRPRDDFTATLDYTYAELELDRSFNNYSAWFNFGGQESVWTDGPQASPIEYTENSSGSDFAMGAGSDAFKNTLRSTGINLLWDVNDRLSMELDYHDSRAENKPNSGLGNSSLLAISAFTRDVTSGFFGEDLPVLQLGLSDPLSPDDMIVTGSVFANNFSRMDIDQTRLGGVFNIDTSFIESIDFGVQFTNVDNRAASATVQRDAWGGVTQPGAIADLMTPASGSGSFDEIDGSGQSRQLDFFTYDINALIARTEALIASGDADLFIPGNGDLGPCGTALCPTDNYTADRRTSEDTQAIYGQLNMGTEWGGKPIDIRLGLRYETTDVDSTALAPNFTNLIWVAGNELTITQDGSTFTSGDGDYDQWLPNFDFSIDITDQWIGRVSASKTLTRPLYGDIQGGLTLDQPVRVTGGTGARGNPGLDPFESDNIDLSVEFYYGDDNYASVGYFHKDVSNFIGTSSVTEMPFGLPHPALGPLGDEARAATGTSEGGALFQWILENRPDAEGVNAVVDPVTMEVTGTITGVAGRDPASPFNLSIPVNFEDATMDGWELNIQHNFGDSGFGLIANATFVDADVGYDDLSLATQFVLTGFSDSANVIAYYDKNGIAVRVAYNWRDDFLADTGQPNVGAGPPNNTGDYQQIDLSASYELNDSLQFFLDAINITDETTYTYGRDELQTLTAGQLGARYNLGVRWKF